MFLKIGWLLLSTYHTAVDSLGVQPLLDPIDDPLVYYRLELPGEKQILLRGVSDPTEIVRLEVVRTATAPVDHGFVLALAAELSLPVGHVQVVVDVRVAEPRVSEYRVEKGLGWQQSVLENLQESGD